LFAVLNWLPSVSQLAWSHGRLHARARGLPQAAFAPATVSFFVNLKAVTVVLEACAGSHWLAGTLNEIGHIDRLASPQ